MEMTLESELYTLNIKKYQMPFGDSSYFSVMI